MQIRIDASGSVVLHNFNKQPSLGDEILIYPDGSYGEARPIDPIQLIESNNLPARQLNTCARVNNGDTSVGIRAIDGHLTNLAWDQFIVTSASPAVITPAVIITPVPTTTVNTTVATVTPITTNTTNSNATQVVGNPTIFNDATGLLDGQTFGINNTTLIGAVGLVVILMWANKGR